MGIDRSAAAAAAVGSLLAAVSIGSCGGGSGSATGEHAVQGSVLVSAAASLADAFSDVELAFEEANPGVDVLLNLSGSSALREQILGGAPVDVFASADIATMDQVVAAGEVEGEPRVFVRNALQIATPAGNPADVIGLTDFADGDLLIGLCAPEVPCGSLGRRALELARVIPAVDTNEPNVRALLTKIETGELDAGIVYVSDVSSTDGAVVGVDIPDAHNPVTAYPIAVLTGAPNPDAAEAFVGFMFTAAARTILSEHGFVVP